MQRSGNLTVIGAAVDELDLGFPMQEIHFR